MLQKLCILIIFTRQDMEDFACWIELILKKPVNWPLMSFFWDWQAGRQIGTGNSIWSRAPWAGLSFTGHFSSSFCRTISWIYQILEGLSLCELCMSSYISHLLDYLSKYEDLVIFLQAPLIRLGKTMAPIRSGNGRRDGLRISKHPGVANRIGGTPLQTTLFQTAKSNSYICFISFLCLLLK